MLWKVLGTGRGGVKGRQPDGRSSYRILFLEDAWELREASITRESAERLSWGFYAMLETTVERNVSAWSKALMGKPGLQAGPHSVVLVEYSPPTHQQRDALSRTLGRRSSSAGTKDE